VSDTFSRWLEALEARHLADLTFPEVARALRALSSTYVERRRKIAAGAALSGAGKRAAFALFYGPLHFLLIRHIVATLPGAATRCDIVVDLGCGTGAAGAAWASGSATRSVLGIDRSPWATAEANRTYREFGLDGRVRQDDVASARLPKARSAIVAAFTMNELSDEARDDVMARLVARAHNGDRILVVEPLAGFVAPWWNRWRDGFESIGGRADEWRVKTELPPIVAKLDRAAGLDHREITGRSLWSA
jgi:SAM-dependent methyltransferase